MRVLQVLQVLYLSSNPLQSIPLQAIYFLVCFYGKRTVCFLVDGQRNNWKAALSYVGHHPVILENEGIWEELVEVGGLISNIFGGGRGWIFFNSFSGGDSFLGFAERGSPGEDVLGEMGVVNLEFFEGYCMRVMVTWANGFAEMVRLFEVVEGGEIEGWSYWWGVWYLRVSFPLPFDLWKRNYYRN